MWTYVKKDLIKKGEETDGVSVFTSSEHVGYDLHILCEVHGV